MGFKPERLAHRYRAASFLETARAKRIPAQVYECNLDFRTSFERDITTSSISFKADWPCRTESWLPAMPRPTGLSRHAGKMESAYLRIFHFIGFDNITEELPYIELTTVAVSHEEQMETAVELLLGMVEEARQWGERLL